MRLVTILNSYPFYEPFLRSKLKTTTFRLGPVKPKIDEVVDLTVAWDEMAVRHLHRAQITAIYQREIKELGPDDFQAESPDCKAREAREGVGEPYVEGVGLEGETLHVSDVGAADQPEPSLAESARASSEESSPTIRKTEKQNTEPDVATGRFRCVYCRQDLADNVEYLRHKCRAKTRAGWECIGCHATFAALWDLKDHFGQCSKNPDSVGVGSH